MLTAFYDLAVSPTSFDLATFVTLAEIHRLNSGYESMQIVFVPTAEASFWNPDNLLTTDQAIRLERLLVPLCSLWPSCTNVVVLRSRSEVDAWCEAAGEDIFPQGYRPGSPIHDAFQWAHIVAVSARGTQIPRWQAPLAALKKADDWIADHAKGRRVIAITLREASYYPQQNSNVDAWGDFARRLDPDLYFPVVVRDTQQAMADVPPALRNATTFPEASLDVALRAALYRQSHLCLMSANGPMMLLWLNAECRSIVFGLHKPDLFRMAPIPLRGMGIEIGRPLPGVGPFHHVIWQSDTPEAIDRAFSHVVRQIERNGDEAAAQSSREGDSPYRLARRLRRAGRQDAAREIYQHLQKTQTDPIAVQGAALGSALSSNIGRNSGASSDESRIRPRLGRRISHDPDMLLDIVEWDVRNGRLADAEKLCSAILTRHPDHAEALWATGDIYLRKGDLRRAARWLGRSAQLEPWSAAARYSYGVCLLLTGQSEAARAEFFAAAMDDPSHEAARLQLAEMGYGHSLPLGFTYEDAIARRGGSRDLRIGELDFPILLPKPHAGYWVVYCSGIFHAISNAAEKPATIVWRSDHPDAVVAPIRGTLLLARILAAAAMLLPFGASIHRMSEKFLHRSDRIRQSITAQNLADLDRLIGSTSA